MSSPYLVVLLHHRFPGKATKNATLFSGTLEVPNFGNPGSINCCLVACRAGAVSRNQVTLASCIGYAERQPARSHCLAEDCLWEFS